MFRHVLLVVFLAVTFTARAQGPSLPPGTRFIMSHFGAIGGGGDERLYISISPDGLHWTALNNGTPVWQPDNWQPFNNVVRDPSIVFANGFYWVAYTSGNYGRGASFGLLKSTDLLQWTHVTQVSTAVPGATDPFTWSPILFKDADDSVRVFVAISRINGSTFNVFPDLRVHEVHPENADFTAWSAPVLVDLPSTNTNEFFVWREGETYHGLFVDFTRNAAYQHVTSTGLTTGWSNRQHVGFDGYEGGFTLKNSTGGYRLFLERGNGGIPGYFAYDLNDALNAVLGTSPTTATVPARNGKVIAARGTTTYSDWQALELSTQPAGERLPLADPDRDGIPNLLECALGLPPLAPSLNPLTAWRDGTGRLRLRVHTAPYLRDVAVELQTSTTPAEPASWIAATGILSRRSVTLMSDGRELTEYADVSPTPALPQRYFRLRATGP